MKLSELVLRDPRLKGKDKPKSPPSEVFAKVRELEATPKPEPKPEPKPVQKGPVLPPSESRRSRIAHLLDLLGDDSTTDDW